MTAITAIVLGAGQRGRDVYGRWALEHPERMSVVGVCDPDRVRATRMADRHGLGASALWTEPDALFSAGRLADALIVASPDRTHHGLASRALELGYDVLVEKPMAATVAETVDLVRRADQNGGSLHVGHVLRHTPFFERLHEIVGEIGDLVDVQHRENVAAWHMAHSFVRGNWSRAEDSTPMIVAKCVHDFDILVWNLSAPVDRLMSYGSLLEFRPERAPRDASDRCLDCPVPRCPYDARDIYLDPAVTGWPVSVICDDPGIESRRRALREGPYGVCAYRSGSTVVDHQVVAMQLGNGATATLTMHGHSDTEHRSMRYDGTRATVRGVFGRDQRLELRAHAGGSVRQIDIPEVAGGHGGGDSGIMAGFVEAVIRGTPGRTDAASAIESHLLAFAAEQSRTTGLPVNMTAFRSGLFGENVRQ